eukprot:m.730048 g.730048  ORF g.730048 m.730048 type:complete len:62 (-) comp58871_c1_seq90:3322-3507(-)
MLTVCPFRLVLFRDLSYNPLTVIAPRAFEYLTSLTELHVTNTLLTSIGSKVFAGLTSMQFL